MKPYLIILLLTTLLAIPFLVSAENSEATYNEQQLRQSVIYSYKIAEKQRDLPSFLHYLNQAQGTMGVLQNHFNYGPSEASKISPLRFDKVRISHPQFCKVDQIPQGIKDILVRYGFYPWVKKQSTNIVFMMYPERKPFIIEDQLATIDYHTKSIIIRRSSFNDLHVLDAAAILIHEAFHLEHQITDSSYHAAERGAFALELVYWKALDKDAMTFPEPDRRYIRAMITYLNNSIAQDQFRNPTPNPANYH